MRDICLSARQRGIRLFPILVYPTQPIPWFVQALEVIDATRDHGIALQNIRSRAASTPIERTFGVGRDAYLQSATLIGNTIAAYAARSSCSSIFWAIGPSVDACQSTGACVSPRTIRH